MISWFTLDRLDRYSLRLITGPFAMALVALLLAQLLERLLRLFDLAASAGAPPSSVLVMAATLVPHYLGLALPMAFTAAIFMAAAHMCDDNELDVMLVAGRSIARIAAPYFLLAMFLCVFSLYLYGQLQPLARYGYHVAVNRVLQTGWDARVEENRFIDIGHGITFSADVIEGNGRDLRGVLMERRSAGNDEILTAARGHLVHTPDGLQLQLEDGQIVRQRDVPGPSGTAISVSRFAHGLSGRDFAPEVEPLADRGSSVRERTLHELWRDMQPDKEAVGRAKAAAEFHGRLARAMTFPLLPLLALPLGMASKRGRRTPGVIFAVLALLAIHHALQLGESLAESGRLPAAAAVWTPFAVFAALSLWIFRSSLAWPGDNPVLRAVMAIEAWFDRARTRTRPKTVA
ncbi:MAG TPA: LptF/LptG family permease [Burkholderiaceae bacterium]|nr:LptF/LptG family permease [Burkholderiaceae bacterium]